MQTFGKSISSRRYDWSWSITLRNMDCGLCYGGGSHPHDRCGVQPSSSLLVPSHSHYVLFISYQPVNSPYLHFKIAEQKLNCITHLALMDLIFRLVEYVMDLIL